MSRYATIASLLSVCVLAACYPESPSNTPVSQSQYVAVRNDYQKHNPDARVGLVTAVLTSEHLASVGSVQVKDFAVGDIISFIDANGNTFAIGQVEAISNNRLDVRYQPPANGREPIAGDLAVRAIK